MKERLYHRKDQRVELSFNIQLVSEYGMQRGCRVVNISQGGVLLEWSLRRDDVSDIRKYINIVPGMLVNMFFILGVNGTKENINISTSVTRTTANGVAIEFHQPQPELMESLTVKEPADEQFLMASNDPSLVYFPPEKYEENKKNRTAYLMFVVGVLIGAISITVLNYYHRYTSHEQASSEPASQAMVDDGLKSDVGIQRTEEDMPSSRAEIVTEETKSTALEEGPAQPVDKSASTEVAENDQSVSDEKGITGVEWIINLITFSNKQLADKLTEKAHGSGIPVMQEQVDVNGAPHWRLRVYGFVNRERAEEYAEDIKQHLNIDKIWIVNRKKP